MFVTSKKMPDICLLNMVYFVELNCKKKKNHKAQKEEQRKKNDKSIAAC